MEITGVGKSPNSSLSFRYNANNEELEELFHVCEDDPPTPQCEPPPTPVENASPRRGERSSSIIDKYFKSIRTEKPVEKHEDAKSVDSKQVEEAKAPIPKEVSSSPMKEYLNRLGKRSTSEVNPDVKEGSNETWKIFHDFKFKIAQAVEDMKTRSLEETKEKSIPRENSISDSEENSAFKDSDQQSVGDTDNQVSSLDSSIQNLSEMTQPLTAKANERDPSLPVDNKNNSDSSDDTHKNLAYNESAEVRRDFLRDSSLMEVESGIEALEDTIDGFGDIHNTDPLLTRPMEIHHGSMPAQHNSASFGSPPSKNSLKSPELSSKPKYFFNFTMYFFTFLIFLNYILFPNSNIWNGFVFGLWFFCFMSNLKSWLLDTYFSELEPKNSSLLQLNRSSAMPPTYTIPSVMEHRPIKKYEGWINHYRVPDYDPNTYHINKTTTAFMKLEGSNLRISYTSTKIPKRALWDEKLDKVAFYQHRLYNLTGARVILLPKGLVKRRQWSKKYPICVILSDKETIQVLEKESSALEKKLAESASEKKKEQPQHEETETNTSPEKKRKFVWRKREKSISHSDGETGKEGLRHRLVRKMHRDKKTDSVSTATEPVETQSQSQVQTDKTLFLDDSFHDHEIELTSKSATSTKDDNDEEFDDNELSKIKDVLEETEMEIGAEGTVEGEWSVHVKHSTDKHSHLYLFARTGRDKHEWYRRLIIAITEANAASSVISAADDKSASDPAAESKDNIELAVYKLTEKETVAFAKASSKTLDSLTDSAGVTITSISQAIPPETDYEKTFWPYLLKIIQKGSLKQSHEITFKQTSEAAVMCQLEPTPRDRSRNKKKRKANKSPSPDCTCRMLPAEVTWLNTALARIMYDLMRDPIMVGRLQNRIQRKLNTLKLPSFMSPLVVTELSLAGACPLVERVLAPAWDARGVWLDADLRYDGGAHIALLTQINLLKLKEKNMTLEDHIMTTSDAGTESDINTDSSGVVFPNKMQKPAIYDSDVEDSAESSSDDESPPVQPVDSNETIPCSETASTATTVTVEGTSSKKKFLRMVDKIATNKYFQQVTDYKYVKRAMEGLSNTDIKLHLEVHALEGRLAINLPPPPHDRVWLGFRTNPQLVLKARPAVGARTLRFAHITNWIEQKLSKEFEKVLVLPNMEDIIIDVMTPTPVHFE